MFKRIHFIGMDVLPVVWLFAAFCAADRLLAFYKLEGRYYAIHAVHNAAIASLTAPNVFQSVTRFSAVEQVATPTIASQLILALHVYHCVMYFDKLRFDDWLHHVLMIGVALPLGLLTPAGSLMGMSLFFTTGLPGGLDYVLLTLVRNGLLASATEKRANAAIQVWIRSPGCVATATLICAHVLPHDGWMVYKAAALLTAALNYWNGQYFMAQVVHDVGMRQLLLPS